MKYELIFEKVLKKVKLPEEEIKKLKKLGQEAIDFFEERGVEARIGGSLAKGTVVKKKTQDIDIFVVFEKEKDIKSLEGIVKEFSGDYKKVHGSRDYFQVEKEGVVLEFVPVLKTDNPADAKNITDVSLMHVDYVSKKIRENKRLADEIILAKSFCNACGCYGAESYISGFSGYALEVLVIYFGSFLGFLKGIRKEKIIDPMKYFKNKKEVLREINSSKLQSPVIVVDPTYKYRNVCAGLGDESFERFLDYSERFLKDPSEDFFFEKEKVLEVHSNKGVVVKMVLETDRQEGDIAGTKMKKVFRFVCKELERNQQKVVESGFVYEGGKSAKAYVVFRLKREIEVAGPLVGMKEAVESFLKAKKEVFKKRGRYWWVKKIDVKELLEDIFERTKEMGAWVKSYEVLSKS